MECFRFFKDEWEVMIIIQLMCKEKAKVTL